MYLSCYEEFHLSAKGFLILLSGATLAYRLQGSLELTRESYGQVVYSFHLSCIYSKILILENAE